jgi:hypothetical protein
MGPKLIRNLFMFVHSPVHLVHKVVHARQNWLLFVGLVLEQLLLLLKQLYQRLDVILDQVIEIFAIFGFLFDIVLELLVIVVDVVKKDLVDFGLVFTHLLLLVVERCN